MGLVKNFSESIDQIRNRIRLQRLQLPSDILIKSSADACQRLLELPEYAAATHIAAYMAINGEIDTSVLLHTAWQQGKQVYLPVLQDTFSLLFAPYSPASRLRPNRYRILEPQGIPQKALLNAGQLDIIVTPLVAFDSDCNRIGMGAGYYDRTLAGYPDNPVRIGLAHAFQQMTAISAETWDIPMHKIITNCKIFSRAKT